MYIYIYIYKYCLLPRALLGAEVGAAMRVAATKVAEIWQVSMSSRSSLTPGAACSRPMIDMPTQTPWSNDISRAGLPMCKCLCSFRPAEGL